MTPIKTAGSKGTRHPGIKRLPDGRWHVTKTWTNPKTGKRTFREKLVSGSLEEAQAVRASLREHGPSTSGQPRQKLRDFAAAWLERRTKKKIEPSTAARYTHDVANLNAALGDYWVDAIDFDTLDGWQADMGAKYAAATVNSWHRTLRLILDGAVRRRLLLDNPARELSTLTEGRTKGPRGTPLTAEQLSAFIAAIPRCVEKKKIAADTGRGVYVYAWTGMRAGEIVALGWSSLAEGEIDVSRSVWRGIEKTDKTDDPRRVPIVEPLQAILDEQRQWLVRSQHPGLASGLVFPASPKQARAGAARRKGGVHWYRSQTTFQEAVRAVCEEATVPTVTPHALRRTFENLLRAAGVDQLVRRAMAGWRSDRAQGIYATVSKDERHAATSAVVRLVLGQK